MSTYLFTARVFGCGCNISGNGNPENSPNMTVQACNSHLVRITGLPAEFTIGQVEIQLVEKSLTDTALAHSAT